ncbi:hypothetical protein B566_EDAN014335 [Ephemera danica]|nr:hypothetical protein B566_EDAN014335 [Ephemera danica]
MPPLEHARMGHSVSQWTVGLCRTHRSRKGGTLKRVAWPPPPDSSVITATAGHDFQYQDGETNHVNGVTLQANPPAPLFYSPPPKDGGQPKWEASSPVTKWEASPVPAQQQRWDASPAVTVFSLPPKVTTPPPPPTTVTLRPQAPISQAPAPLIKSQPAIERQPVIRSAKMRGDQKWPPPEYKAIKQAEESGSATKGPAVKPRLVRKDYSSFFAQHALTPTYPGYRAPPGTQHYDDQGRPINNGNY